MSERQNKVLRDEGKIKRCPGCRHGCWTGGGVSWKAACLSEIGRWVEREFDGACVATTRGCWKRLSDKDMLLAFCGSGQGTPYPYNDCGR